jgi:CRP-like cAMP-binding protein
VVSGSGNLDILRSPKMIDPTGWKIYDATPNQRGEERRELQGKVTFSQFIRPLEMRTGIPPFRLVFFDPDTEKYETITTDIIPLVMSPAKSAATEFSGPPPSLATPVERMSDILGMIDTAKLLVPTRKTLLPWMLHLIAAALSLALVGRALWMRYGHLFERDETKRKLRQDFDKLVGAASGDGLAFLRAAGGFAERWQLVGKNEEIRDILDERDRLCFREAKADVPVPKGRRDRILRSLRKAALGVLIFALAGQLDADEVSAKAKEAYDAARYEEAAKLWLEAGSYKDLGAGAVVGVRAAIDGAARSTDVLAIDESLVATLSAERFNLLLRESREANDWMLKGLVEMVRELSDRVFEVSALRSSSVPSAFAAGLPVPIAMCVGLPSVGDARI